MGGLDSQSRSHNRKLDSITFSLLASLTSCYAAKGCVYTSAKTWDVWTLLRIPPCAFCWPPAKCDLARAPQARARNKATRRSEDARRRFHLGLRPRLAELRHPAQPRLFSEAQKGSQTRRRPCHRSGDPAPGTPLRLSSPATVLSSAVQRQQAGYSPWRRAGVSSAEERERPGEASLNSGLAKGGWTLGDWREGGLFRSLRLLMGTEARDTKVMHFYWSLRSRDRK